ncbi:MAG TPA: hypothetical protein VGW75_05410 [Solirubrobacteraceae bacterium]|jgi:hypothetical protein|nr:hypothetical protein [Solirubrobacteraceae bacterium]
MGGPEDTRRESEELLRRALLDASEAASVALKVQPLSTCDALTIIFHGRRDLGTVQTYVAHGTLGSGNTVGADDLLRVPCDLDLADAGDRREAEELYAEQAKALRDAIVAADTVLTVWREPLEEAAESPVAVDRSIDLRGVQLPAHRLMPVALVAPERQLMAMPVCGARTLAAGRPPMGIALAQQDVAHVYPLADDPETCLGDFLERAARHARRTAERLDQQEASVERFLEISGDDQA